MSNELEKDARHCVAYLRALAAGDVGEDTEELTNAANHLESLVTIVCGDREKLRRELEEPDPAPDYMWNGKPRTNPFSR